MMPMYAAQKGSTLPGYDAPKRLIWEMWAERPAPCRVDHRFDSDGEQDSILDKLTDEDRNALACWLADIHGVEAADREYRLPQLPAG